MGLTKGRWLDELERGWSSSGQNTVCFKCFNEPGIQNFITDQAAETECSYCGASSDEPIAVDLDEVIGYISRCLSSDWCDLQDTDAPYDSEEGKYFFVEPIDVWDLLQGEADIGVGNMELFSDIADAFHGQKWCQKEWQVLSPRESLFFAWERFCLQVKHRSRYFFSLNDGTHPDGEGQSISDLAAILTKLFIEHKMIYSWKKGRQLYRARATDKDEICLTPAALGTVPRENCTQSNRMSPSGIPMFYGALEPLTAIRETTNPAISQLVTVARFQTSADFIIVDLTNLPRIPSIYEVDPGDERAPLGFLHDFVRDLAKPIEKDGREHIEYVPTQIVTEYFRSVYQLPDGRAAMGLIYPSATVPNGSCCVLFIDNEGCGGPSAFPGLAERQLELEPGETRTYLIPLSLAEEKQLEFKPPGQISLEFDC